MVWEAPLLPWGRGERMASDPTGFSLHQQAHTEDATSFQRSRSKVAGMAEEQGVCRQLQEKADELQAVQRNMAHRFKEELEK